MCLAEAFQIHFLTVEGIVPFADPPGGGGGPFQRGGGEDAAPVAESGVIHLASIQEHTLAEIATGLAANYHFVIILA